MNANKIKLVLAMGVLMAASAGAVSLSDVQRGYGPQPAIGQSGFSARESDGRGALIDAFPDRREEEHLRIEGIARAQGYSQGEARAIADNLMVPGRRAVAGN